LDGEGKNGFVLPGRREFKVRMCYVKKEKRREKQNAARKRRANLRSEVKEEQQIRPNPFSAACRGRRKRQTVRRGSWRRNKAEEIGAPETVVNRGIQRLLRRESGTTEKTLTQLHPREKNRRKESQTISGARDGKGMLKRKERSVTI